MKIGMMSRRKCEVQEREIGPQTKRRKKKNMKRQRLQQI